MCIPAKYYSNIPTDHIICIKDYKLVLKTIKVLTGVHNIVNGSTAYKSQESEESVCKARDSFKRYINQKTMCEAKRALNYLMPTTHITTRWFRF
jgi:hypothetical protein